MTHFYKDEFIGLAGLFKDICMICRIDCWADSYLDIVPYEPLVSVIKEEDNLV